MFFMTEERPVCCLGEGGAEGRVGGEGWSWRAEQDGPLPLRFLAEKLDGGAIAAPEPQVRSR